MIRFLVVVALSFIPTLATAQVPTSTPTPGAIVKLALHPLTKTISVGDVENYEATGFDANGVSRNLTQKVDYTSSDPTIASTAPSGAPNKGAVTGVAPGVATITATYTDPTTQQEVSTTGQDEVGVLTVQGALQSITLTPTDKKVGVGDTVIYEAIGNLSDGNKKNLTQKVVYSSSDTSVAVCPNASGNKSQVQAVGLGVATITATDPKTQISSDASGTVTLTVRAPSGPTSTASTPTPNATPRPTSSLCGDPDASGSVTVTDGVQVLEAAAGLPSACTDAVCDVDNSGEVTVTDGVLVLRVAAELGDTLTCP